MFKLVSSHNTYYILAANVALAVAEWHRIATEGDIHRRRAVDQYRDDAMESMRSGCSPKGFVTPTMDGHYLSTEDGVIRIGNEKFVSVEPLQGEFLMAGNDASQA